MHETDKHHKPTCDNASLINGFVTEPHKPNLEVKIGLLKP
jgi:hypothetical protein